MSNRYVIFKGGHLSVDHLPGKTTEEEAQMEVARMEAHRAEKNARVDKYRAEREAGTRKFERGDAFIFMRDDEPYTYKIYYDVL
jgi:hypothetical protein